MRLSLSCKMRWMFIVCVQAGNDAFLVRRARVRTRLLRQASSRKLQRFWRSFCRKRLTTAELAARFIATGVPTPPPATASCQVSIDGPSAILTAARTGSVAAPLPVGYVPASAETPANSPAGSPSHRRPAVAVMGPRTGLLDSSQVQQVLTNFALTPSGVLQLQCAQFLPCMP